MKTLVLREEGHTYILSFCPRHTGPTQLGDVIRSWKENPDIPFDGYSAARAVNGIAMLMGAKTRVVRPL